MTPQRLEQIRAGVAQDAAYWNRSIVGELLEEVERQMREGAQEKLRIATDALRDISMLEPGDETCGRWAHGQAMIALTRLKAVEEVE